MTLLIITKGKDFMPKIHPSPQNLFRFALPYIGLGLCGGSLYFVAEYDALKLTSSVNVGIITSCVPVATAIIMILMKKAKVNWRYFAYSALAIVGVAMVIINGRFSFEFNAVGDMLAVAAMFLWAAYSIILDRMDHSESSIIVSRRLFFWALLTILPSFFINTQAVELTNLKQPEVALTVLYLGGVASAACIWMWDVSIRHIGAVDTNKFLYLMPIVALFIGIFFLNYEATWWNTIGAAAVIVSCYMLRCRPATTKKS